MTKIVSIEFPSPQQKYWCILFFPGRRKVLTQLYSNDMCRRNTGQMSPLKGESKYDSLQDSKTYSATRHEKITLNFKFIKYY